MTDSIETSEGEAMPWVPPVAAEDVHAMTYKLPPLPEREAFEAWMQGDATISLEKDGHGYVDMTAELMWHAWKARAAIEAQGVPDGWQLVPKEPTPGMLQHGVSAASCHQTKQSHSDFLRAYKAMLAASPAQPKD